MDKTALLRPRSSLAGTPLGRARPAPKPYPLSRSGGVWGQGMTQRNPYSKGSEVRSAAPDVREAGDGGGSSDSASRVNRLLEHDDPASSEYPLARFAAAAVVAEAPNASLEEHEALLDARLEDALAVQDAAGELAVVFPAIERQAEAAERALGDARFDDGDAQLRLAEESGVDATTRARIRSVRAEAALVRGDAAAAAEHYGAAASHLESVAENGSEDRERAMLLRSGAVGRLIRHADTFGGDGAWIGGAMELCNANIRHRDTHPWNRGARQMDAGSAQISAGRLTAAPEALDLFLAAEYAYRMAGEHFDRDRLPTDWAAAQNGRGLAKTHFCLRYEEATGERPPEGSWVEAENRYRSAMEVQRDVGAVQWAKTRINLGYLLVHRGRTEGGEGGREWLRRAVDECRGAQEALRADVETDLWVDAQQIMAQALLEAAEIAPPDDAMKHLLQAMVVLTTAKDVLAGDELTFAEAGVDRLMARLERQAARLGSA